MQRLTSPQSKKRPTVSKVMLLTEVLKKPQIAANLGTFFLLNMQMKWYLTLVFILLYSQVSFCHFEDLKENKFLHLKKIPSTFTSVSFIMTVF